MFLDKRRLHSFSNEALRDILICVSELEHTCAISCHTTEVEIIQISIEHSFAKVLALSSFSQAAFKRRSVCLEGNAN